MLPGFVGQQSASAADPACAGVVGATPVSAGHAADSAGVPGDAAAAFDNALSSACGTASAPPVMDKTGCADKSAAAPSPTFPAWILALGLDADPANTDGVKGDTARGIAEKALGDATSRGTSKTKQDGQETHEETGSAVKDDEARGIVVDVIALTPPALGNTPPMATGGATGDSATSADVAESGHNVATEEGGERRSAQSGPQTTRAFPNRRVQIDTPQQSNDDVSSAMSANVDAPVQTNDDSPDDANTAPVAKAELARTRVATPADLREVTATVGTPAAAAAAAPGSGTELERIVSASTASPEAATAVSRPQAAGQSVKASTPTVAASRLEESMKTVAAASPATESAAEGPLSASPSPSAAVASIATGEAAPETRRASAPATDPNEVATTKPVAPAVIAAAPTAGGRNQSFQHADSESHARNAWPEPPPVSRSLAWSSAMTLITAPDGTLRLTAPLATTSFFGAQALLEQPPAANVDQMVQTMRVMVKDGVSEATVHLHPEHFGEVSIQVRVDGKSVSAIVHTESAGVREWLQGQESALRGSLSEQGLQLDRLVVQRDGRQDRRHGAPQQQEQPRRRAKSGDHEPTFEVAV